MSYTSPICEYFFGFRGASGALSSYTWFLLVANWLTACATAEPAGQLTGAIASNARQHSGNLNANHGEPMT
jgi:hypothetical protein